jgi:hypothetical protein
MPYARERLPPNMGFQPTAPAEALKIVRILTIAFPIYEFNLRRGGG